MADIVIRGMEMPKEPTNITIYPDGCWCDYTSNDSYGKFVVLPEGYGRLIDADALDKFLDKKEKEADTEEFYIGEAWYKTFRQILRATQPIVPVEGG